MSHRTEVARAFESAAEAAILGFQDNAVVRRIDAGTFDIHCYHRLLLMIFHQTHRAPQSFALAGAMLTSENVEARNYLIRHAAEEHTHWEWALEDLQNTGFLGPDPRREAPPPACAAYIGFNYYIALTQPVARLAIAAVLEGLGATYSARYAQQVARQLGLQRNQMRFFLGHSDTDVEHSREIREVISTAELGDEQWRWMACAAETAGMLYTRMYDEAGQA